MNLQKIGYYFLVAYNCQKSLNLGYDVLWLNNGGHWKEQFSYDEQGLGQLFICYTVFYFVVLCVHLYGVRTLVKENSYHNVINNFNFYIFLFYLFIFNFILFFLFLSFIYFLIYFCKIQKIVKMITIGLSVEVLAYFLQSIDYGVYANNGLGLFSFLLMGQILDLTGII